MDATEELIEMTISRKPSRCLYTLLHDNMLRMKNEQSAKFQTLLRRGLESKPSAIDINHVYPYPLNKTLLDIACCEGITEAVKILLHFGADPNRINDAHHRGPIHFAAELSYSDVLQTLLDNSRTNPNLEVGRETALHFSVKKNDFTSVKILLNENASPNIANSKGMTPIHIAALNSKREIVELILNHAKIPLNLDDFRDFKKQTARDILIKKFPDIQLPPRVSQKIDYNILRFYLDANDEDHFIENLKHAEDNLNIDDVENLILLATEHNFQQAVMELLKNYELNNISKLIKAAESAIKQGNHEILIILLDMYPIIGKELLLTACQELGVPLPSNSSQTDRLKCLQMILDDPDLNVRCEDDKGNTPLHYAARANCPEAVRLLLQSGSYIGHKNILGAMPLADIPPNDLQNFFSECLQSNNTGTDDYEMKFDYQCLIPHQFDSQNDREFNQTNLLPLETHTLSLEMEPLHYIANSKSLRNLLKHPLLSSFLYLKWHQIRHLFYLNWGFYAIFYILINYYILSINFTSETIKNVNLTMDNSTNSNLQANENLYMENYIKITWILALIFWVLLFVIEVFQCLSSPFHFIRANWLMVVLIILSGIILVGVHAPLGAVVHLLSAWKLITFSGQHPKISIGIEMFKTVSLNLMYFILPYTFLIIAFALAFFTLFKDESDADFPNPARSLFKTIVMLTGEFDASDIPFFSQPILSHLIFILFVFLIIIVLFNLLIGVAVSDTAEILEKSELVELISRTELITYTERILFQWKNKLRIFYRWVLGVDCLSNRVTNFLYYARFKKIIVMPYKANVIQIYSDHEKFDKRQNMTMDPKIVLRTNEILRERGNTTENEKIMAELRKIYTAIKNQCTIIDNEQVVSTNTNASTTQELY